jgi:hypothetical protein
MHTHHQIIFCVRVLGVEVIEGPMVSPDLCFSLIYEETPINKEEVIGLVNVLLFALSRC